MSAYMTSPPILIIDGKELEVDAIDFRHGPRIPPEYLIPAAEFKASIDLVLPDGKAWDGFNQLMRQFDRQVAGVLLGQGPCLRERDGYVEQASAKPVRVSHPAVSGEGLLWTRLAKTRGRRSTGLRKFVWRRGELVEVRSRGRSGSRDLLTAIQEAGAAPCPQPIPLFKIELNPNPPPLV